MDTYTTCVRVAKSLPNKAMRYWGMSTFVENGIVVYNKSYWPTPFQFHARDQIFQKSNYIKIF